MGAFTIIADVFDVVVLVAASIHLFSHVSETERRSPAVMLGFAYTMQVVSNLYWIAHEIMTKEAIYEFSAIDVASAGFYILFGASLAMVIGRRDKVEVRALLGSGIVALVQVAMWVVWAGSWFKNVLGGLPVWYATYYVILAVRETHALPKAGRIALQLGVVAITVVQLCAGALDLPTETASLLDTAGGLICLAGVATIDILLYRSWQAGFTAEKTLALAFLGVLWAWSSMFLMFEPLYSVFLIIAVVQMAFAGRAVTGWVEQR